LSRCRVHDADVTPPRNDSFLKTLQTGASGDLIEVKVQPHAYDFVCSKRPQYAGRMPTWPRPQTTAATREKAGASFAALPVKHDRQAVCSLAHNGGRLQPGRRRAGNGPISSAAVDERTRGRTLTLAARCHTIALATTGLQTCQSALRAMPRGRQGRREPARDRACVSHFASQVSGFRSATAPSAGGSSGDAAVPT